MPCFPVIKGSESYWNMHYNLHFPEEGHRKPAPPHPGCVIPIRKPLSQRAIAVHPSVDLPALPRKIPGPFLSYVVIMDVSAKIRRYCKNAHPRYPRESPASPGVYWQSDGCWDIWLLWYQRTSKFTTLPIRSEVFISISI